MRRLAAITALALSGCLAHFPRQDEPTAFLEPTTIATSPGSDQLFEAEPALHVYFLNQLDDPAVQARGGFAVVGLLSLLAQLRVLDEPSTPIRTPSFEPRVKLQILGVGAPRPMGRGLRRLLGAVELSGAHYSNGQKGCALADHLRGSGFSDFDCIPETDPPSTALNTTDGSFATNYLGAALRGKLIALPPAGGPSRWTATAGAGVEWHLPCGFSGCMDPPMRARHGSVVARWAVDADLLVLRGWRHRFPLLAREAMDARVRASVRGRVHLGSNGGPFGDVSIEAAFVPRLARGGLGLGPFVRLHRGRDYLNIRFEERLDTWTFGVVIDPAPPDGYDAGPLR